MTRTFRACFFLACVASLVPLWLADYPPMVDLAQHAAQVSIAHGWDGPFDYSELLWINWRTPYLVSNLLAYVLAFVVPASTSFQCVISLGLVGLPFATWMLLREVGVNPWRSLAVLPTVYSYAFYMGFVAFLLATPLALLTLVLSWRHAKEPSPRRSWGLVALLHLLFFTHVLPFGWAGLLGASWAILGSSSPAAALRRLWPYLAALPLPLTWLLATRPPGAGGTSVFFGYHWGRLTELPALVVGWEPAFAPTSLGLLLLALPFLLGGAPSRDPARWIPVALSVGLVLLAPAFLFGTGFLNRRFAVFLVPALCFAFDSATVGSPLGPKRRGLALGIGVSGLLWLASVGLRIHSYGEETGEFQELLRAMEAHQRVLYLPFERDSEFIPYPVYLHAGVWYQVERGGLVDFSFATFFPNRYRYAPEARPPLPESFEWRPWVFDWRAHGGERYDYLLVRSLADPSEALRRSGVPLALQAHAAGGWWLYGGGPDGRRISRAAIPRTAIPETAIPGALTDSAVP